MKLYATVTSERASKGQGGNEYIEIELKVQDRINPIGYIVLDYINDIKEKRANSDEWVLKFMRHKDDVDWDIIAQGNVIPEQKGKQQKGELVCGHNYCDDEGQCLQCGESRIK